MEPDGFAVESNGIANDFWLFGYGSLIWKPPPHYAERHAGYIKGYVRRFWQSSSDHRGTEERPGRVVTLVESDHAVQEEEKCFGKSEIDGDDVTWGMVYRFTADMITEVHDYLDLREINGYSRHYVPVFDGNGRNESPIVSKALVYIGTPLNPAYVGPSPVETIADRIISCKGPSGENTEYLLEMAQALRDLSPDTKDRHVWDLETAVLQKMK